MEPEREPQRPETTPPPRATPEYKTYQSKPTATFIPVQRNYSREVCVIAGVLFLVIGLVGFVVDDLLGAHLSYTHTAIFVASGALSTWFGFDSEKNARRFSYVFGTLYGLVGIAGFVLGKPGVATVANMAEDRFMWKAIPRVLEFGTADHIVHLLFAIGFLLGAALTFKSFKKI